MLIVVNVGGDRGSEVGGMTVIRSCRNDAVVVCRVVNAAFTMEEAGYKSAGYKSKKNGKRVPSML